MLQKLIRYPKQHGLAKALREMGRIEHAQRKNEWPTIIKQSSIKTKGLTGLLSRILSFQEISRTTDFYAYFKNLVAVCMKKPIRETTSYIEKRELSQHRGEL